METTSQQDGRCRSKELLFWFKLSLNLTSNHQSDLDLWEEHKYKSYARWHLIQSRLTHSFLELNVLGSFISLKYLLPYLGNTNRSTYPQASIKWYSKTKSYLLYWIHCCWGCWDFEDPCQKVKEKCNCSRCSLLWRYFSRTNRETSNFCYYSYQWG